MRRARRSCPKHICYRATLRRDAKENARLAVADRSRAFTSAGKASCRCVTELRVIQRLKRSADAASEGFLRKR
jgi:hypothetical protein